MFSLKNPIEFMPGHFCDVSEVEEKIWPLLTPERQQKIQKVAENRCFDISVVLEGIYDRGNISAVMRTAEGLGFADFHIIETFEKFKNANRVTQGADKWVESRKWKTTTEAIKYFKDNKIRICIYDLSF